MSSYSHWAEVKADEQEEEEEDDIWVPMDEDENPYTPESLAEWFGRSYKALAVAEHNASCVAAVNPERGRELQTLIAAKREEFQLAEVTGAGLWKGYWDEVYHLNWMAEQARKVLK